MECFAVSFFLFFFFFSFPTLDGAAFPGSVVLRLDCFSLFIYFLFSPTPPLAPSLLSRSPSTRFSPGAGAEDRGAGALSFPSTDVGLNLARV